MYKLQKKTKKKKKLGQIIPICPTGLTIDSRVADNILPFLASKYSLSRRYVKFHC